jgi:UDP-N-acetylmuramoylalanine--D-glutamate ligase
VRDTGDFRGKRVTVVGLGASGAAAAHALINLGALVRVTESASTPAIEERAAALKSKGAEVETGGHGRGTRAGSLAVVSPGVPRRAPVIDSLRRGGAEVISEVELAYRLSTCDFLAVTGTNGKTTTTSLLAAMLQAAGFKSVSAGNIGWPLIEAIDAIPPDGTIVVEVSSFQLETIESFRPKVAVLLNVSHDHIDWHETFDEYTRAKARIVVNQTEDDTFVFNADDVAASRIAEGARGKAVPFSGSRSIAGGVGVDGGGLTYRGRRFFAVSDIPLPGLPGVEDVAAAACAALEYGVDLEAVRKAISEFQPLHHRLEPVMRLDGVHYIDDSKATNPHATLAAVQGLEDVVLIAGGRSKGIDLAPLIGTVPPVRAVVAIGEAASEIERIFSDKVPVALAASMTEAVRLARSQSIPGGSVLLSPGCASLDMFESYAARGEEFARAVRRLTEDEA